MINIPTDEDWEQLGFKVPRTIESYNYSITLTVLRGGKVIPFFSKYAGRYPEIFDSEREAFQYVHDLLLCRLKLDLEEQAREKRFTEALDLFGDLGFSRYQFFTEKKIDYLQYVFDIKRTFTRTSKMSWREIGYDPFTNQVWITPGIEFQGTEQECYDFAKEFIEKKVNN